MKINFRKISAIAASALMAGMSMGVAAAANYPAPFVSGGVANVAVVYGSSAATSDVTAAANIENSLGDYVSGGTVSIEGGDAFVLDKDSNHFNFNDQLSSIYSTLDDDELEVFLAEGEYDDGSIDEEYSQKITLSSKNLSWFTDNEYNNDEPLFGFTWDNGDFILNYTLSFDSSIAMEDMVDTYMPLMGKKYYVLDISSDNETITLLDSAETITLYEGETKTIGTTDVTIYSIDSNGVKFTVDGENTEKLEAHEYDEVDEDVYLLLDSFHYDTRDGKDSFAEISLGNGKLELIHGEEIEVNDEDVDELEVYFGGTLATGSLDSLTFVWNSDGDNYLTEEDALTMPLFETIKLVFGGMEFPEEAETIALENGETMTLSMGNYDLPLAWLNTDISTGAGYLGTEDRHLVTATGTTTVNYTGGSANTTALTGGMDLVKRDRFLITNLGDDLSDIDTWYYEVSNIDWADSEVVLQLDDLIGNNDITFDSLTDTEEKGDLAISIKQANDTHVYLNFSVATGTISYNTAVSESGMWVILPAKTAIQTLDFIAGETLTFVEADKDGDLGEGIRFTATVKNTSDEKLHVSTYNATVSDEEESDDVMVGYVLSDLASKVTSDQTGDENDFEIEYYGAEVTADVQVVGGTSTISSGASVLGDVKITDTEVGGFSDTNLIVVGGSCINSAAAALVGGKYCGAAWTQATGAGEGKFIIKPYADSTITEKLALLVAGYEAADTTKAATALINEKPDTSKGVTGVTATGETTVLA